MMTTNHTTDPKAIRKACLAADHLAKAVALLRAAADASTWAQGKADFLHYAIAVEELITCDNGEGGLAAAITMLSDRTR